MPTAACIDGPGHRPAARQLYARLHRHRPASDPGAPALGLRPRGHALRDRSSPGSPSWGPRSWCSTRPTCRAAASSNCRPSAIFHLGDAWEDAYGTIRFDVAAGKDVAFAVDGARVLVERRGAVPGEPAVLNLVTLHADGRAEMTSPAASPPNSPRPIRAAPACRRRLTVHTAGETAGRPLPTGLASGTGTAAGRDAFDFGDRS